MLHELLLALKGHHGGIYRHSEGTTGIQLIPSLPFVQPSEETTINQLCKLGTYYKDLKDFIQHYGSGLIAENKKGDDLHGLYLKYMCQGLDKVLLDYKDALLDLEQDVLRDPHLPISHIASKLNEFYSLFPALASTVDQVVSHRAHGCYILDILHKNRNSGRPIVKNALNRILFVCHGLMFKQIAAWMLHGITSDPFQEFFIQPSRGDVKKDGEVPEEDPDDELGIMGLTGRQLQKIHLGSEISESSMEVSQFRISADLLPSYIPPRVANKIVFVGESVQMFERDKHKMKPQHRGGTIMKDKEEEFSADLMHLSKQAEFNTADFESVVDKIRTHVAEYLWVLVVKEADLWSELRIMKEFFLLGRGELYLAFVDQAQHLLRAPVTSTTEHDVNRAFQHAARDVSVDNDDLQRFHLTVPGPVKTKKKSEGATSHTDVETGWNVLGLTYSVLWPLHTFFTPSVLEKYKRMFSFLLAVRRTQLDLQHCWSLQMYSKQSLLSSRDAYSSWQLRMHMAFFVDNLQYYLQVDVIESQYKILHDKINSTKDFEAAKLAHEHFLSTLLAQSFVHMKTVSLCLHEILDQCSLLCRLLVSDRGTDVEQVEKIALSFQNHSSMLFQILSGVRNQSARPHLVQLLLRLDYNKFFTKMGGQLGM